MREAIFAAAMLAISTPAIAVCFELGDSSLGGLEVACQDSILKARVVYGPMQSMAQNKSTQRRFAKLIEVALAMNLLQDRQPFGICAIALGALDSVQSAIALSIAGFPRAPASRH